MKQDAVGVGRLAAELLRLMRPKHWIKNGFVLMGYIFAHGWEHPGLTRGALLALGAFTLVSSCVYVINDLADRRRDRLHPVKRNRPIAAGRVSPAAAAALIAVLLAGGLALAAAASYQALGFASAYLLLNVLYSHALKDVVILDVFSIASGFLLRVLTGTLGIGIPPSDWLLLCTIMLSLFLGFGKRFAELSAFRQGASSGRRVLEHYSEALLGILIGISSGAALVTYALYTVDPETRRIHQTEGMIYTVPIVTYGLFRYLYVLYGKGSGQDPAQEILADGHLLVTTIAWLAIVLALIL